VRLRLAACKAAREDGKMRVSEALELAADCGTRQAVGELARNGTYCAIGAILRYGHGMSDEEIRAGAVHVTEIFATRERSDLFTCPECGRRYSIAGAVIHMNDDHRLPFRDIAGICRGYEDGRGLLECPAQDRRHAAACGRRGR